MFENPDNLNKNKKITLLFVLTILFLLIFIWFFNINSVSAIYYTPASPTGSTLGFINTEYEYVMDTNKEDSSWKFDWGDGNYSDWGEAGESGNLVSQSHSWSQPGVYNVRIKYRNRDMEESSWSPSLSVDIAVPLDTDNDRIYDHADLDDDNDGVLDEEDAFPKDPNEWKDTDNDGTGDNADVDDDGDGFDDDVEKQIGSNSTKKSDVIAVDIDGTTHYLIDKDGDGKSDIFYNTISCKSIPLKVEKSNTYLIDINGDGNWDYTYDGTLTHCESPFEIPWSYIIATIVLVVIVVLFILFKLGVLYVYEEEYEVEE